MAKDTLTVQFQLEAAYDIIQAIRQALADDAAQTRLISHLRETAITFLAAHIPADFDLHLRLKVSAVPKTRRGQRSPLPTVTRNLLAWSDEYTQLTHPVGLIGSAAAAAWLDNPWTRSFRYESELGTFTAVKEKRRGRSVWYAHRRRAGHLKRVYLGSSDQLTPAKLALAARKLNSDLTASLTQQ
jgi:hypothetical protein